MKRRSFYKLLRHLGYVYITAARRKGGEKDYTYYIDKHDDSKNYPNGFPNSPCPTIFNRKLLVYPRKLLGNIACCLLVFDFLAQQLTDRHLEYLGKPNKRPRIWHGLPLFPLGHGLPDHMKSGCQLLLREALLFS